MKWYGYIFVGTVILAMIFSPMRREMPIGSDLVRTLEDLEMPPEDLREWRRWLANMDSIAKNFSGGNNLTIDHLIADTGQFNSYLPHEGARARSLSATTIPDSTYTAATFASADFDTADSFDDFGFFDTSNPTRLTVPAGQDGMYLISGRVFISGPAMADGDYSEVVIKLNGTSTIGIATVYLGAAGSPYLLPSTIYELSGGDYVELIVYQDSGNQHTALGVFKIFRWR